MNQFKKSIKYEEHETEILTSAFSNLSGSKNLLTPQKNTCYIGTALFQNTWKLCMLYQGARGIYILSGYFS
jgi:hypothetical protein